MYYIITYISSMTHSLICTFEVIFHDWTFDQKTVVTGQLCIARHIFQYKY